MNSIPNAAMLPALAALARRAGAAIMEVYASEFEVTTKSDKSPVTLADLRSEKVIDEGLRALTPDIPIVSEEAVEGHGIDLSAGRFWLVDPLDGTREFVKRNGEFTVNIGLIEGGRPTIGILYAPAQDRMFAGAPGAAWGEDQGAAARPLRCTNRTSGPMVILGSRSHRDAPEFEDYIGQFEISEIRRSGSALKYGQLAAGEGDFYPRFGRTMEWDTAAGHAILLAAGGCLTLPDGKPLAYGKPGFGNPAVVAWGTPEPLVRIG